MLDKKVADLLNTQVNKEFYSAYLYLQDLPSLPASQSVNKGILYENLDKHRRDIRILHIHFGIYLQREIEIIAHQRSFHRQILLHETDLCG